MKLLVTYTEEANGDTWDKENFYLFYKSQALPSLWVDFYFWKLVLCFMDRWWRNQILCVSPLKPQRSLKGLDPNTEYEQRPSHEGQVLDPNNMEDREKRERESPHPPERQDKSPVLEAIDAKLLSILF